MYLSDSDTPYLYEPAVTVPAKKGKKRFVLPDPFRGFLAFAILVLAFEVIGSPLVTWFGMYGNAVAEILAFGVGSVMIICAYSWSRASVFPLKKPETLPVLGVVLLWFCSYRLMTLILTVSAFLFPRQYAALSDSLGSAFGTLPLFAELIVTALVPAVTEEMLHRGLLQYSLRGFRKRWLAYLMMGIYFGAFHMSLIRFLPMCLLGIVLAYIRGESGNIFYAMLFHFLNNAYSVLADYLNTYLYGGSGSSVSYSRSALLVQVGYAAVICAVVPFGLYLGAYLFNYAKHDPESGGIWNGVKHPTALKVFLITSTALLAVGGLLVLLFAMLTLR